MYFSKYKENYEQGTSVVISEDYLPQYSKPLRAEIRPTIKSEQINLNHIKQ